MKIDSTNRTQVPSATPTPASRTQKPGGPSGGAQDNVQLSSLSTQIQALETGIQEASGFDAAKVEAIKQAISEGRFTIHPDAIADKLIASTRELLARQKG